MDVYTVFLFLSFFFDPSSHYSQRDRAVPYGSFFFSLPFAPSRSIALQPHSWTELTEASPFFSLCGQNGSKESVQQTEGGGGMSQRRSRSL